MRFNQQTVIITGGASGIGAATAKLFLNEGAKTYVLDIIAPDYSHPQLSWFKCDVANFVELASAVAVINQQEPSIDYLFANAGVHFIGTLEATSLAAMEQVLNINFKGVFYTLKLVLPIMRNQGKGSVVLMGSDQTFVGRHENAIYGATKAAIGQLTKSTALDYAQYNIRINCVCPGAIDTPLTRAAIQLQAQQNNVDETTIYAAIYQTLPLSRLGKPEEVANLVAFLCSDAASFITGALVCIDGGFTAQ